MTTRWSSTPGGARDRVRAAGSCGVESPYIPRVDTFYSLLGLVQVLVGGVLLVGALGVLISKPIVTRVDHVICGGCKYSMDGIAPDALCPECGAEASRRITERRAVLLDWPAIGIAACAVVPLLFAPTLYGLWWAHKYRELFPEITPEFVEDVSSGSGSGIGAVFALGGAVGMGLAKFVDRRRWVFVAPPVFYAAAIVYPLWAWHTGAMSWRPGFARGTDVVPSAITLYAFAVFILCPAAAWIVRTTAARRSQRATP